MSIYSTSMWEIAWLMQFDMRGAILYLHDSEKYILPGMLYGQ